MTSFKMADEILPNLAALRVLKGKSKQHDLGDEM